MSPICPCAVLSAAFGGRGGQGCACGGARCSPGFPWACGLSCGRLHRHRRRASLSIGRDSFWGRLCQCRRLCLRVCRPQGRRSRGSGCCRFFGFSLVTSVVCRMGRDAGLDGFSRGSLMQWLRKAASGNSFPGKQCATLRTGHRQLRTYACLG